MARFSLGFRSAYQAYSGAPVPHVPNRSRAESPTTFRHAREMRRSPDEGSRAAAGAAIEVLFKKRSSDSQRHDRWSQPNRSTVKSTLNAERHLPSYGMPRRGRLCREVGPGFSCHSFAERPLRRCSTKAEHRARLLQHPANRTQNLRRVPSQYKDKYEDDAEYHDGVEGC